MKTNSDMEATVKGLVDICYDRIRNAAQDDKIIYDDGQNINTVNIEDFIKQGADGVLYDLNRLEEVTLTLAKDNVKADMKMRFTNDLAMATLVRYLLRKLEETCKEKVTTESQTGTTYMD
jgi:hypothetical protein